MRRAVQCEGRRPRSKFFQFDAVFGKIWQNRMLAPLLGEILDPPLIPN